MVATRVSANPSRITNSARSIKFETSGSNRPQTESTVRRISCTLDRSLDILNVLIRARVSSPFSRVPLSSSSKYLNQPTASDSMEGTGASAKRGMCSFMKRISSLSSCSSRYPEPSASHMSQRAGSSFSRRRQSRGISALITSRTSSWLSLPSPSTSTARNQPRGSTENSGIGMMPSYSARQIGQVEPPWWPLRRDSAQGWL
mmetsp:Transcript_21606/g.53313  ORF Transcript_21606/g.53313 Transcript_21606/m.53313 type:complete len:202 (+) Transcript_21606:319-924(+)